MPEGAIFCCSNNFFTSIDNMGMFSHDTAEEGDGFCVPEMNSF